MEKQIFKVETLRYINFFKIRHQVYFGGFKYIFLFQIFFKLKRKLAMLPIFNSISLPKGP